MRKIHISKKDLRQAARSSLPLTEEAERIGVTRFTLLRKLHESGIEIREKRGRKPIQVDEEKLREAVRNGKSLKEVADGLKISVPTLRRRLKASKVSGRSRRSLWEERQSRLKRLHS